MRHKVKEKPREHVAEDQCSHYWIIEMANGPESHGVCQYCGEGRYFLNVLPYLSVPKRSAHPLDLPGIPDVKLEENSKS